MHEELDAKLVEIEEAYPDDYEDREDWNELMDQLLALDD
jgi:hypothetical protein